MFVMWCLSLFAIFFFMGYQIRKSYKPSCTKEQRKFLDVIEKFGYFAGRDDYEDPKDYAIRIPEEESWGPTEISQISFPGIDLGKVVSGK